MKFPTPYFDVLRGHYRSDPRATHICVRAQQRGEPSATETAAMRMSEALCIATGLVRDRVTLSQMAELGDGRDVMLGKFGYKADLCAHGMARNAADLAYFLLENWGRPVEFHRPDDAPHEITDRTGLLAFIDIDGVREKGHVDLWDGSACFGKAYWTCRKVFWWKLD